MSNITTEAESCVCHEWRSTHT